MLQTFNTRVKYKCFSHYAENDQAVIAESMEEAKKNLRRAYPGLVWVKFYRKDNPNNFI